MKIRLFIITCLIDAMLGVYAQVPYWNANTQLT